MIGQTILRSFTTRVMSDRIRFPFQGRRLWGTATAGIAVLERSTAVPIERGEQPLQQGCRRWFTSDGTSVIVAGSTNKVHSYAPIYVAATRQHVGKTSVSLALMSGLQKRFDKVGFIKPVGQQSIPKTDDDGVTIIKVDKDAALIKDHFQLSHISYQDSSPVLIPPGYTRDYLDGNITNDSQIQQLLNAFHRINVESDIVLCEGTGHVAVGSIVDLNNAECAKLLDDAQMILVANGGLGHCFDELELNRTLCNRLEVNIAGIVLNKVRPDKYEQTKHYFEKALEQKWDNTIPLLGCIPDRPFLGSPALADLERLVAAEFISGGIHRLRHFRANDCRLVATSLEVFLQMVQQLEHDKTLTERKLFVCHASRNDIILGYIMMMETMARQAKTLNNSSLSSDRPEDIVPVFRSAMLITGAGDHPLSDHVVDILRRSSSPVLLTRASTDDAMAALYGYTPKLHIDDEHRVDMTVEHYEPYIDFDVLLSRCRRSS